MDNALRSICDLMNGRQHHRILRLSYPHENGPASMLLVNSIIATESLSKDFEFTVELLSDNPCLPLKDLQGKLLCVELVRADGSLRYFTGYVFSFQRQKSDGGITYYEAKLGPWLKYLSLRRNSYLFHNKSIYGQTESIFAEYSTHVWWDWRITSDDPPMTDACQFDETDFNYLSRRWEQAGWFYWYEHTAQGHQLVVADDSTSAPPIDGDGNVRFQKHGGIIEEDSIDRWSPIRTTVAANVTLTSHNFKHPISSEVSVPTLTNQGEVPLIESHEHAGAYGYKTSSDGYSLGKVRMEEIEGSSKLYDAEGNNRFSLPGRSFTFINHFAHDQNDGRDAQDNVFLILAVHHVATNNYLQQPNSLPQYRNALKCTRKSVPWRPGRNYNSIATRIAAPQTATVVGPNGGDSVYTDEYGRVKIQFHWDRVGRFDEASSAWVRVASLCAGSELGSSAIPRVGSEVIVQWLGGNPDRPIITGSVYNGNNMPPWQVPSQRALTGLRSRELSQIDSGASKRGNHLILDDTNSALQAQLKSDHQCSQLSLGSITRIDDTSGRKDARGDGWEITTNAWGVARAAKGMLITTEARLNAESSCKSMNETSERLGDASALHADLAAASKLSDGAQPQAQQETIGTALKKQTECIQGGNTNSASFPELMKPHLILASPAGIATTTAGSTHIASSENTSLTTGKCLSIVSGDSLLATIRQCMRIFVHKAGMKLIAAAGDIDIQALSNGISLLAKLEISQSANTITITAKEELVLVGGGSYARFNSAGVEHGTNGNFTAHASKHSFVDPKNIDTKLIIPTVGGHDADGEFIFSA